METDSFKYNIPVRNNKSGKIKFLNQVDFSIDSKLRTKIDIELIKGDVIRVKMNTKKVMGKQRSWLVAFVVMDIIDGIYIMGYCDVPEKFTRTVTSKIKRNDYYEFNFDSHVLLL